MVSQYCDRLCFNNGVSSLIVPNLQWDFWVDLNLGKNERKERKLLQKERKTFSKIYIRPLSFRFPHCSQDSNAVLRLSLFLGGKNEKMKR